MGRKNVFSDLIKKLGLTENQYQYPEDLKKKLKSNKTSEYEQLTVLTTINWGSDEVEKNFVKLINAGKTGIIRSDLLFYLHALITRSKKSKELLKDFKDCISPYHYEALILSETIITLEDKGLNQRAKSLKVSLERRFKEDGRRIYNLHRSGYIKEHFHFYLSYSRYEYPTMYKEKFREYFEEQLEFFPHAIWANEFTSREDIQKEIRSRIKEGMKEILLFGRGDMIVSFLDNVSRDFVEFNDEVYRETEPFELGGCKAIRIKISVGKKKSKF